MAFEPDKWADGKDGGTPITAAELNRMEQSGADAAKTATWGQVSNRPSAFPASAHTHEISEVNGLETALADLASRLTALETGA